MLRLMQMFFDIYDFLPSIFLGLFVAFFIALFFYFQHIKNPITGLTINFWYAFLTGTVSIIFVDLNEIYMSESQTISYPINSYLPFIFLNLFIVAGYSIVLSPIKTKQIDLKNLAIKRSSEARFSFLILIIVVAINFINIILSSGLPIGESEVRRFNYWESYAFLNFLPNIWGILIFFLPFVSFALGIYFKHIEKNILLSNICFSFIVLHLLYLFLTGQKFNGFVLFIILFYACINIYNSRYKFGISIFKVQRYFLIGIAPVLLIGIIDLANRDLAETVGTSGVAAYRILVLQSSTFWTLYDNYLNFGIYSAQINSILLNGSDLISQIVLPFSSSIDYVDDDINLSSSIPGYFLIFFGMEGAFILCFFYGCLLGLISYLFYKDLINFYFYDLFLSSMIFLSVISCYSRGSLEEIFSLKFLVLISIYVILKLLRFKSSHVLESK